MGNWFLFWNWGKVCVLNGYGKREGQNLFCFFLFLKLQRKEWLQKAQKKIIPTVPFVFIIPLACLSSPDRILSLFECFGSSGNDPYLIQSVLPVIHLFCHVLGTHPLTSVS